MIPRIFLFLKKETKTRQQIEILFPWTKTCAGKDITRAKEGVDATGDIPVFFINVNGVV